MEQVIFDINNVSVGYGSPILAGVSAAISTGELILMVGKNGAGKSTFLKVLKGNLEAMEGEVLLRDKPLSSYSVSELSREIAVVNTSRPSLTGWTVEDVLQSTLQIVGRKDKNEFAKEALELCMIAELRDRQVDRLSDGEFQKVMIARAVCQLTPVIILDEPTSFLDVIYREHVLAIFSELKTRFNTTLILSSHNFEPLLKIASQVWILSQEKVLVERQKFSYTGIIEKLK